MSANSISTDASPAPDNRSLPADAPVALLARRDAHAMDVFVREYQDRLYSAVLRMVANRDDAADIVQDALAKAIENIRGFAGQSSLYTWVFRIAVNEAITHLRRRKLRLTQPLPDAASSAMSDATDNPADTAANRLDYQHALTALAGLSDEHRLLIVLRDIDGADYQQMAAVTGLPVGTVKSRLFRARLALRHAITAHTHQPDAEAAHEPT
ncbi:MAG: sigma-70 family RNA polymerase sigma factor [Phycisphaerales bacterium]|nr:sigma-70 family RNA polymerase sigma factor [Phycisphaerales bacterium]